MALKQAKKIVIDLGLVIECKEAELLPERLLCAWRICRPDLTQTVNIDWVVCLTRMGCVESRERIDWKGGRVCFQGIDRSGM